MKRTTRIIAAATIFAAMLSMSGTANAWPTNLTLSGVNVVNSHLDTLTINAALTPQNPTWGGGGGTLIWNGTPAVIECLRWWSPPAGLANTYELYLTAITGATLLHVRIVVSGNQQHFGTGAGALPPPPSQVPPACNSDWLGLWPVTSTNKFF